MKISKNVATGFLLFVAGGFTVWIFDHVSFSKKAEPPLNDPQAMFDRMMDDENNDPFAQLRQMQQQMQNSMMQQQMGGFQQTINAGGEISQREDEKYFYYDVDLGDGTLKEMQAELRGGQLQIRGRLESSNTQGGMAAAFSSIFNKSLPVPPGVDAEKFRMDQEGKKLVISFPKTGP